MGERKNQAEVAHQDNCAALWTCDRPPGSFRTRSAGAIGSFCWRSASTLSALRRRGHDDGGDGLSPPGDDQKVGRRSGRPVVLANGDPTNRLLCDRLPIKSIQFHLGFGNFL